MQLALAKVKLPWSRRARVLVLAGIVFSGSIGLAVLLNRPQNSLALGVHTLHPDDAVMWQAQDLGAQYLVQVFSWSEIEPTRGEFHWEYTDWLARAADYYNLKLVARLDKTPAWAASSSSGLNSPPSRTQDYADFAGQVAARYRGRVAGYIIWNEPNLAREWGDRRPDPNSYVGLLVAASAQIRAIDPQARVLSAGLAPTNDNGQDAQDDRLYLRAMYAAGAKSAFDILAAHPYGFANAPDDGRGAHDGLNYARLQDLRDIMIENGDAAKPVWITEFGYATTAAGPLQVTEDQQAQYLTRAYQIASQKWDWVRLFTVWNLPGGTSGEAASPPSPNLNPTTTSGGAGSISAADQAAFGLARRDGSLKPAYAALENMPKASNAAAWLVNMLPGIASPAIQFPVLARDAIVHLGDSEYPSPWVPLYRDTNPSADWQGEFYLRNVDLAGSRRSGPWSLTLEVMQVNDFDSAVTVNGEEVPPYYLPAADDFTSVWTTAQFQVPASMLVVGRNQVAVHDGKLYPAFQQLGFTWDDFQFRNVMLTPP